MKIVINMCFCSDSINCAHLCPKIKFTPHEGIGTEDVTLATGLTKCEKYLKFRHMKLTSKPFCLAVKITKFLITEYKSEKLKGNEKTLMRQEWVS